MPPEGWSPDVASISRNDQAQMLGNGVVPAQCAAALRAFQWDAYGIGAATRTTIPLPVDAATTADDAADYLVQMHREAASTSTPTLPSPRSSVRFFGGFERDGMDVADEQYAADKDES